MSSVKALPVGHVSSPMYVVMDSSHGIKKNAHWTPHHEAANAQYVKRPPHPQLPGGSSHHSPPLTGTRGYPYPQDPAGGRSTVSVASTYATSVVANSSPHHMPPHPPGGGAGPLFTANHLYRDAHFQVDSRPQPSQQQQQQHTEVRPIEHRYMEQQHVRRRLNLRPTPEYVAGIERERYMEAIRYQYEREVALGPFANAGVQRNMKPFAVSVHTPSEMDVGQPVKRPRLAAEPKAPVHQPLVIDTGNIVIKKEPAYNPQVEAISPTLPPEEGRCESPMKILKENILGNINRLDKEIDQVESQVSKLQKKLNELEVEASKPAVVKEAVKDVSHVVSKQMSIAQIIYSENRTKAVDSHTILGKLGPKVEMPLYNQPSDTAVYHENKRKYMTFKGKLISFFRKRHRERESRENYLTDTYSKLTQEWSKKMEKRDSNPSKKAKDAKTREFFEKQFPELKKQREDKERMTRVGQRIRSDAEWEEIIDGLQEQELEEKKMRSYAVIPPILLDSRLRKLRYVNRNGLIEDLSQEYKEKQLLNIWTDQEKELFREKYLQHPKNFSLIASCLDRKTVADCVNYYYLSKKSENFKQLLRKHSVRKRTRAMVKPQQAQQTSQGTGMTTRQQEEAKAVSSSISTSLSNNTDTVTVTTAMDSSMNMLVSASNTTATIPDIVNGNSSGMPSISNALLSSDPCVTNSNKTEPKMPVLGNDKDVVHLANNLRKKKDATKKGDGLDKAASDSDTASDHKNENGPSQPCAVCKLELDNLNQSRPLTKSNCSMYGIKDSELIGDMRVCASCRFKSVRKRCPIPTCKTPKRKVKRLRPLPGKLSELTKELKDSVILEFQIPPEVNKCCSACFNRITRKLESNDASTSEPAENSRWNDEETEAFKKGLGQFGTNWESVATSVGTKNKEQCRNFYFNYKRKLGLDQILKENNKVDGVKDGEQQDEKPPPIVTDEEESGETTSSCEEDNCVDRCSSDTASAPSPAEKIIEEDKSSTPRAAPFLPAVNPTPLTAEEQRSQPLATMDANPPCSADYDSSATVSADEGQNQNDGELRDSSPRIIQSSNHHHGSKLTIVNDNVRKTYNPPILKEMETRPEAGVPLVKTLLQDPNIGAGHSEMTRPSYLDQPPVKAGKEEPTCVRDLIYQAIEMSLQWPVKPGRNSSPIPSNISKDNPEIANIEPKKEFIEATGVSIPPVAHCGSHRPSRPGSQHTELNVMDCEVQDLSKKSKSRDSSPPRDYIKRERVVTPARPPSESNSSSSHGHYYGAPPPAHCNQYRSSQPPPALSPHYVGEPHHDPYYPRGSEPRNKAYSMTERPHSQPPHLVAQASATVASTVSLTSHPKTIVAKSSVPPPPPLIASKPTQLSPKLPYKDRLISVPTGSITQGTPVNQQSPAPVTPVNIPSARYEGFLRQLPPPQVKDSGSITLGTPVQHEQVRRIPSGRGEAGGHIPPAAYDPAVVEYFRHVSPINQPYPFPAGVAGYPPNAVPPRPPYANESQLSSKQIMIDFNTSKQMQLRRGITGDKDVKISPRGSESSPIPVSEAQLHPMYPPVNYQGASGPVYVNHQGNYPPTGDSRFPHHRTAVGPLDRNHSPSGTESPVNVSFTHPGKRSPGLAQGANRQNVIHRSITWGTGKPSVIQAPQSSSSPRTADGRNEASSPAMVRKSTPSPRHPQPLIYQPVPPSGHDAFNTLVNAAVAQPSLVVPKDGKGSPASRQETKSPRDRPVVEGLEKTLIDMHQRPRSYMESTHNNSVPHNDNGRSNGDHAAPENRHLLGVASENRRYLNAFPHSDYDMSRESPRHIDRQVLISDHHSSSLRLSNMREPFSREQFERQMRQQEVSVSRDRDRTYIEKDHDRERKLVLAENHASTYAGAQQSELDNEASKIFSQSFQKDIPRSGSSFTAANLIDAIITRQINQNPEPSAVAKNSSADLFNQYHSAYDDSKIQQRPPSTKVSTRTEVVTIDDEADTGKSTPSWNERPSSHGRSPPVQISTAPNILPVMPVPYTAEKVVTLGEHIAAIISKDYNSPTDMHQSPPFYSNSQLNNSASRNSPFTSGTPHAGSKQLEGIAAALPTDSLLASPNVPRDSPDHSPQNCPGNGCVYHTHSWKLRRALQQDKEREHRSPALTDNSHPRPIPAQVVGSPVGQDERQIIRVSQTTSPSVQTPVRSSPVTPYAVEPISPPTHPSDGMNIVESGNRNRMNSKGTNAEMSHNQSPAWTNNPSITGLLTTRHLYPQEYSDRSGLPPLASHFPGAPSPNGGSNRPPHHQQQQMGLSPLDYVKNRIVEVMRTATDDNPESHEPQHRLHPGGHADERDHHQMQQQQQQHLYKFQQQTPDREISSERPCSTGSGIPQLASQRYSPAVSRYSPVPPRPSSAAERVPSRNSTPGEQLQRNHHKRSLEGHHSLQEWRESHRPGMSSRSPPEPQLDSPLPRKKMRSDSTFIPESTIDHAPVLLPENSSGVHRVPHTEAPRLSAGGQPILENRSSVKTSVSTNNVVSPQGECFVQSGQPTTDCQDFRHSGELRSDAQWEVISTRDRVLENNRLHSSNSASSSVSETASPVARDSINVAKPMDTSRSDGENCTVSSSNAGLLPETNRSSPSGNSQRQTPNNSSHYPPYSVSNSGVNCNNTTSSLPPPSSNQHLAYSSFSGLSTTYAYPYSALSMRSLTTTSASHNSTPLTNSTVSGTPHSSSIPISNPTSNSPSPLTRNNSSSNNNNNQPPPLLSSQYEPLSDED